MEKARALAARLGFSRMTFEPAEIGAAQPPPRVHLVTALHACDTATDDALALAIRHGADHVAVVPCCQAEVAAQLGRAEAPAPLLAPLFEHAWHRREFGSHLTNVVRALALEASGYSVTVTELAGWEHSLKNELILGKKVRAGDARARARLLGALRGGRGEAEAGAAALAEAAGAGGRSPRGGVDSGYAMTLRPPASQLLRLVPLLAAAVLAAPGTAHGADPANPQAPLRAELARIEAPPRRAPRRRAAGLLPRHGAGGPGPAAGGAGRPPRPGGAPARPGACARRRLRRDLGRPGASRPSAPSWPPASRARPTRRFGSSSPTPAWCRRASPGMPPGGASSWGAWRAQDRGRGRAGPGARLLRRRRWPRRRARTPRRRAARPAPGGDHQDARSGRARWPGATRCCATPSTAAAGRRGSRPRRRGQLNDVTVAPDGSVYATDSEAGRLFRAAPGAATLTPLGAPRSLPSANGGDRGRRRGALRGHHQRRGARRPEERASQRLPQPDDVVTGLLDGLYWHEGDRSESRTTPPGGAWCASRRRRRPAGGRPHRAPVHTRRSTADQPAPSWATRSGSSPTRTSAGTSPTGASGAGVAPPPAEMRSSSARPGRRPAGRVLPLNPASAAFTKRDVVGHRSGRIHHSTAFTPARTRQPPSWSMSRPGKTYPPVTVTKTFRDE